MPQKDTLDRAAYTCMLVSYRRLSSQFQFSLSGVTLVYCISMITTPDQFVSHTYLYVHVLTGQKQLSEAWEDKIVHVVHKPEAEFMNVQSR